MALRPFILSAVMFVTSEVSAQGGQLQAKVSPRDNETSLKGVMPAYAVSIHRIENALWRDDFAAVASEARAILNHAVIAKEERQRIIATLHEDTGWFKQADVRVHKAALAVALAADAKKPDEIVKALGEMQAACIACHIKFRERLRSKP